MFVVYSGDPILGNAHSRMFTYLNEPIPVSLSKIYICLFIFIDSMFSGG